MTLLSSGPSAIECPGSVIDPIYAARQDLDVVLLDDGASALRDEIMSADWQVQVLHQSNDCVGMAQKAGMDESTGAFITFGQDDLMNQDSKDSRPSARMHRVSECAVNAPPLS